MTNPPLVRSLCLLLFILAAPVFAADPTVTNVRAAQKTGTKQVEIYYDMSGSTSPVYVSLQASSDGGTNFAVPVAALTGDIGANIPRLDATRRSLGTRARIGTTSSPIRCSSASPPATRRPRRMASR